MKDPFIDKDLEPMLIASEQPPFNDPDYIYELKLDGTRCLAYLDQDTQLYNKRKLSLTHKFPELNELHTYVKRRCVLDGELFVFRDQRVDFFASQRRSLMNDPMKIKLAAQQIPASFCAFDIVYDEDRYVNEEPLMKRKERLHDIVIRENERFSYSRYMEENGLLLFEQTKRMGLEGIVAKRKDSRYVFSKRTKDWIKCKHWQEDDFVLCGYMEKDKGILSFVLGQYRQDTLIYRGHVTMGASLRFLQDRSLNQGPCPFASVPKGNEDAVWLIPELVCVVSYMERTAQGGLRQPVLRGIRNDKAPSQCQYKE